MQSSEHPPTAREPGSQSPSSAPARRWWIVPLLAALVYAWFPRQNLPPSPNEISRIALTEALALHGRISIDPPESGWELDLAKSGGRYYTDKAIGLSLLAVGPYRILWEFSGRTASKADLLGPCRLVVVTIPMIVFLFWWFSLYRVEGRLALVLGAGLALGSTAFPFGLAFFGHVPLMILAYVLFRRRVVEPTAGAGRDLVDGGLCGLAFLLDYTGLLFVGLIGLSDLRRRAWIPLLRVAAGAAPVLVILLAYNWLAFGDLFTLSYSHMADSATQPHRSTGFFGIGMPTAASVWGLTFGLRGLFFHSPFLLLAIPGLIALGRPRRWPPDIAVAVGTVLLYSWLNASLTDWEGGWSLGPRYLVPTLPFLTHVVLRGSRRMDPRTRSLVTTLAIAGTTWAALLHLGAVGTWMDSPTRPLKFPALETAGFLLLSGAVTDTPGGWFGLAGRWALVPPLAATAGAIWIAMRPARFRDVATALLTGLALIATTVSILLHLTPEQRTLLSRLAESVRAMVG